jgi:hypothetical protein
MSFGWIDPNQAPPRARGKRRREQQPLRVYLAELWRHPNRALSDIAFERPWPKGLALLVAGFLVSGAALGITGLPGVEPGIGGSFGGAIYVLGAGAATFLVITLAFHGMALVLEGDGGIVDFLSAMLFAMLPIYAVTPAVVLRLLPGGWGGTMFFWASFAIGLWMLRLTYLSIREAHRFSGLQAWLTITGTLLATALGGLVLFFATAFYVLISP